MVAPKGDSSGINAPPNTYSPATLAIHADDKINTNPSVAPSLHVSTTFRYPRDPAALKPTPDDQSIDLAPGTVVPDIYSRVSNPNTTRLETLLSALLDGPSLTYSSGLAAFHALLVHLRPRVIAIGGGYHGCHGVIKLYQRLTNCRTVDLFGDEESWTSAGLGKGDLVHLETPVNPTGTAFEIALYAKRAHARGAYLSVDATFAPPPLQFPFVAGADYIMHSGTKYFGGHSDLLCGVLTVGKGVEGWEKRFWELFQDRIFLGSAMGSLEGWLGVRSLRTLELRVMRQSQNCELLVRALDSCLSPSSQPEAGTAGGGIQRLQISASDRAAVRASVARVEHASLQHEDMAWLRPQMPNGFGPVFALWCTSEEVAKSLPSRLHLFHHATSLGGVESLIEWRRMSDLGVDPRLCRVSVGVEDWRDLWADFVAAFRALVEKSEA